MRRKPFKNLAPLRYCIWLSVGLLIVVWHLHVGLAYSQSELSANATSRSKVSANVQQVRTTAGHSFTVVEYSVPTVAAVPHIVAIDSDDHVWFSESGGGFAKNYIDVPPQNKVGRLDQDGTVSEWS